MFGPKAVNNSFLNELVFYLNTTYSKILALYLNSVCFLHGMLELVRTCKNYEVLLFYLSTFKCTWPHV